MACAHRPSRRGVLRGAFVALAAAGAVRLGLRPARADDQHYEVEHTDAEWKKLLTPAQYRVLRDHGTEAPGSSPLDDETRAGTYLCAGCALPLYASTAKYHSGTGWPSFTAPLPNAVATSDDWSFFSKRTEVHCRRCGGHLGHVFDDGPPPTGQRYCMNGVALTFQPAA
jgi:peptide-methionine (R)-S-oxide reductase